MLWYLPIVRACSSEYETVNTSSGMFCRGAVLRKRKRAIKMEQKQQHYYILDAVSFSDLVQVRTLCPRYSSLQPRLTQQGLELLGLRRMSVFSFAFSFLSELQMTFPFVLLSFFHLGHLENYFFVFFVLLMSPLKRPNYLDGSKDIVWILKFIIFI